MSSNENPGPIVLTGHTGQVGSEIVKNESAVVLSGYRLEQNLTPFCKFLCKSQPRAIINAAAYTGVDQAENDRVIAHSVNVKAVGAIVSSSQQIGARLVHFSTDYVFDGGKRSSYIESDTCNPCNYYGTTKRLSETLCLSPGPALGGVIFRTSWVMGIYGNNFVKTILRLGLELPKLQIIDDQIGRPTSSKLLAQAAMEAISIDEFKNGPCQIVHLSDDGEHVSWFDLAKYTFDRARDWNYLGIEGKDINPISSAAYGQIAKRPKNSVLGCGMFDSLFDTQRRHWQHTIDSIIEEVAANDWQD